MAQMFGLCFRILRIQQVLLARLDSLYPRDPLARLALRVRRVAREQLVLPAQLVRQVLQALKVQLEPQEVLELPEILDQPEPLARLQVQLVSQVRLGLQVQLEAQVPQVP